MQGKTKWENRLVHSADSTLWGVVANVSGRDGGAAQDSLGCFLFQKWLILFHNRHFCYRYKCLSFETAANFDPRVSKQHTGNLYHYTRNTTMFSLEVLLSEIISSQSPTSPLPVPNPVCLDSQSVTHPRQHNSSPLCVKTKKRKSYCCSSEDRHDGWHAVLVWELPDRPDRLFARDGWGEDEKHESVWWTELSNTSNWDGHDDWYWHGEKKTTKKNPSNPPQRLDKC